MILYGEFEAIKKKEKKACLKCSNVGLYSLRPFFQGFSLESHGLDFGHCLSLHAGRSCALENFLVFRPKGV